MVMWILVIIMAVIAFLLFVGVGALTLIYKHWKEAILANALHERTVVRLYMTEDGTAPEIQTFLDGITVDQVFGIVGALEMAKRICLDWVPVDEIGDEESDSTRSLLDGEPEGDE